MISFIVPAHNEEASLGSTLQTIHQSAQAVGQRYEIIVADDASTDATAEIAQENKARIVTVNCRQIAGARNAGARAALGERLFFVDADTRFNPRVVTSALRSMDKGAAGGGAPARFDRETPLFAQFLILWFGCWMRLASITGGAFMFCTREAFLAVGGFDERLFGAEDAKMSWALKREGQFVVLWRLVVTSGRRVKGVRGLLMIGTLVRVGFFPKTLRQRSSVKQIWYDSNRNESLRIPDLLITQAANAFLLTVTIVLLTDPIFDHVPKLKTLIGSPLSEIRFAINILLCHAFLVLWPCAGFLSRDLVRQSRWFEQVKIVCLMALCAWFAWSVTRGVIWFWPWLYQKMI